MSDNKKISVVVLGNGDSLKGNLITNIVGKDLSQLDQREAQSGIEIYENESYEFICTPDLNTASEDIKKIFDDNQHPDMSLLVVEEGFSTEDVQDQIDQLKEKTGKGTDEFIVVLPPSCRYSFRCCTVEQVSRDLGKVDEGRALMSTRKRNADPDSDTPQTLENKVNIVLLGMAGTGKSASGNTILGEKKFKSKISSTPVTTECQEAETMIDGTRVHVIDTPDIFDDQIESSVKTKLERKCKELCKQEPCVYLLVMQVGRFTDGERVILKKLEEALRSRIREQTVILFTRGEDLQRDGVAFEEFMHSCQPDLKKIIEKCGNRCVLFENRASDSPQVQKLMQTVDRMIKEQQKE